MVVCKCRKATRIYCFVHKVPVCGECICFPEHQICVVKNYSDWVVNGEYDWPPTCSLCHVALEAGNDTTRLGCLHIIHTNCLVSHIQSFPPQTAPAGFVCPTCSSPIWPPKTIKDTGSRLHSKLKEAIIQSGLEKNIFGNHLVSLPTVDSRAPPPAFASDPLMHISAVEDREETTTNSVDSVRRPSFPSSSAGEGPSKVSEISIVEVDGPSSLGSQFVSDQDPKFMKAKSPAGPGTTTRKGAHLVDKQNSEISYYADDEDAKHKKYSRRGSFRHKFLRFLLPFWSSALPTLPVTAPPRKDGGNTDDIPEGRVRRQRSSRMDPRRVLLTMAIMACMATMGILYYRLAQRSLGGSMPEDEPQ
ncbi:zinc finger protein-like 1-like protein [Iris pallida]|uniref:Zinc finger protein-like 1-like protein n=1 Tax=Iris pallida TaxID=29817 RepID=A0AAX6EL27_IRIPA|nr:zinc finger protein-like 1-like protein [Iris pallida]KAJ6841952.1 zinc finger protein-like 1-like protein [Iris pallida]